ncbi:Phosphate propanoyltransferase [Paenibacillus sp. CECT 9249]|nr:Phosphate propanoyltransferase [Paenibacillus sp. CECT 9249]
MDRDLLVRCISEAVKEALESDFPSERSRGEMPVKEIPIGVSNRHVHLSPSAVERLFGPGNALTPLRELSQPGQFACRETVSLIGPKGRIDRVRVLGPARGETQVEISLYDGYTLGVVPPVRDSGDIEGTPGIVMEGPRGRLRIDKGVICAARHIHMHPADAAAFGVHNGQRVKVSVDGPRGLILDHVLIRVSANYRLEMHIDLDEANAGQIATGRKGILLG